MAALTPEEAAYQKAIAAYLQQHPEAMGNQLVKQGYIQNTAPKYNEVISFPDYKAKTGLDGLAAEESYYWFLRKIDPNLAGTARETGDLPNYVPPNQEAWDGGGLGFGSNMGGVYHIDPGQVGHQSQDIPGSTYPNGGGPAAGGTTNTSWDWGSRPGGGINKPADAPIDNRYQLNNYPGQDSPWGNADLPGGNKEFYTQQLNNLIAQQDQYQAAAISAAIRARQAENNPPPAQQDPWQWAYGGKGLPSVQTAGADSYSLANGLNPNMTNNQVLQWYVDTHNNPSTDWWKGQIGSLQGGDQTNWVNAGNPQALISQLGSTPQGSSGTNYQRYNDLFNAMYNTTPGYTGPGSVPQGYAAPVNWGGA